MKLSKQKEQEAQIQIEKAKILESNEGNPDVSATNKNEELSLEDDIKSVLEAAKDLPDLQPDAHPSTEKTKNTNKPKSSNEKMDSETVTHVSATPDSDSQGVPDLESVPKENPNLEIETEDRSTGTNFTGIQLKKKEMAMFWDGEMVESENIPEIVFTKESYHWKPFQDSADIAISDVSNKSPRTSHDNLEKTKDLVKCKDLFFAMKKILDDRSNAPHEPPATSAPVQFNASPSKSGARLVS